VGFQTFLSLEKMYNFGLRLKGKMAQNEKSKKSSSKQSKNTEVKEPSLIHLTKQLPTKCRYKGFEVRVLYITPLMGMRGWISVAKKGNLIVAGAESNGNLVTSPSEQQALSHICSLIDLSENSSSTGLNLPTVESLFDE
jgi:hypothetical protein